MRLRLLLPLLIVSIMALAPLGMEHPAPATAQDGDNLHVPSPDWRDQVIYFIMIDRFNDGDPANNDQGANEFDPVDGRKYSGGDLQGIIDELDYIQDLGATAIWITPPVANMWWDPDENSGGYHGYWAENFMAVDAHFGTLETYQALSSALHSRGMYLIQDIVVNHTGNFYFYDGPYNPDDPTENFNLNTAAVPVAAPSQPPFDMNDVTDPEDRAAAIYNWTPSILDFSNPDTLTYGQLSDLDDLNTDNPVVR
ncbi:MAG: alpha-amylase, partial [Chloroflexi bacterium]|nr:alpha-amylase [Chloroflexota bacterium]